MRTFEAVGGGADDDPNDGPDRVGMASAVFTADLALFIQSMAID
jgi:hypothetical protein